MHIEAYQYSKENPNIRSISDILSIPKPTKGIQGNAANSQGSTAELLGKCFKCLQLVPMLQKVLSLYIDYSRKMADQSTKVYASVTADE